MAYKIRFGYCANYVLGLVVMLLIMAIPIGSAKSDIVLLDEYWTPEITNCDVNVTEIDTEQTKDPTQAKSGVWSVQLQNDSGSPNVRFRGASSIMLSEIPPGNSEARVWYRTDKWDSKYRVEIWLYHDSIGYAPAKVLEASLDGGGEDGKLIADDKWHQAKGILQKTGAYDKAPKDTHLATFIWFRPEGGWDIKHRTYLDRLEVVTMDDSSKGKPMPNPIKRVRPNPGAQTTGQGWIWWEGEDAIQHNFPPGGAYVINDEDEQKNFSNGAWLQYHGADGFKATWQVNIPEAGEYDFWCRGSFDAPPGISCFKWRWGNTDWWVCEREMEPIDIFAIREWITDYWINLGSVWLPTGLQTLEIVGLPKSIAFAFDCWLLTQKPFIPNGINKPDSGSQQTIGKEEKKDMKADVGMLPELSYGNRIATHMGCLEAACKYLKLDITPGWLYGGTGNAFVMCLTNDLCPSGPHCWDQKSIHILSNNLPFRIEGVAGPKATPELLEKAWNYVHKSIKDGYPCYGWHYEWVLIKGYDEAGYLYSGRLEPPKEWNKFGADAIGFLELYSVRPDKPASDAKTIRDSLAFAVSLVDYPQKWALEGYSVGLDAYDTWIEGISSGKAKYQELPYHAAVWAECRKFAVQFLEEANKRTEEKYDMLFQPAIDSYKIVAESLENIRQMAPLPNSPLSDEDKKLLETKKIDEDMRNRIVAQLEKAKKAESEGIAKFREIIVVLNNELGDMPPEF